MLLEPGLKDRSVAQHALRSITEPAQIKTE